LGKKKKGLKKKINPEKSNKMIYAVGFGVLILFIVGVIFILNEDKKITEDPILGTLKTLKESDKIIDVRLNKDKSDTLNIIIKEKSKELMRFIKKEAIDLSGRKRKIEFEFIISIEKIEKKIYSLKVKDGDITNFRSIKQG